MSLKFDLGAALANAVKAGVAAVLLGGGTMVLTTAQTNAVQDIKIEQNFARDQARDVTLDKLNETVRQLDKNVAVLNERLKEE